jgi:hypothetical protein
VSSSLLSIGTAIVKESRKPFKSGNKLDFIIGYMEHHPVTENVCYTLRDSDTYVEARMCREATQEEIELYGIKDDTTQKTRTCNV